MKATLERNQRLVLLTKEEEECDAIQNEDIRDVVNIGIGEELHLLLRCAHEEEPGGIKKLGRKVSTHVIPSFHNMHLRMVVDTGNCADRSHPG